MEKQIQNSVQANLYINFKMKLENQSATSFKQMCVCMKSISAMTLLSVREVLTRFIALRKTPDTITTCRLYNFYIGIILFNFSFL